MWVWCLFLMWVSVWLCCFFKVLLVVKSGFVEYYDDFDLIMYD